MLCPTSNSQRWWSRSLAFTVCFSLILLLNNGRSQASMYQFRGICSFKDKCYKPGDTFWRGCDKCFCHQLGFFCFAPMKPTSWPRKCRRLRTECGYRVVYKDKPLVECRAYSWIG